MSDKTIKLPELMDKAGIKKDQDTIRVSLVKLDTMIHNNAIQCYLHAFKHGDTSLMRRLLIDIVDDKSGYRRQGLIAHMRRFTPMELKLDVIKLSGTVNGVPIPWDIETANVTPFTSIPEFAEVVQWKPVFKGGIVGKIERAMKDYKSAVENTKVEAGKVVGPIDPKKPYYQGIYLDKMDDVFDEIERSVAKFSTFNDDSAERAEAIKTKEAAERFLASKAAEDTETASPTETPAPAGDDDKEPALEGADAS